MTQVALARPPRRIRRWDHPAWPASLSAAAALIVYAVTLGGTFVYDDLYIVATDPRIRNPHLWGQFWTRGYFANAIDHLYRPLVSMSYALQWQVVGDRPLTYHVVNWLLHAAVAAAVAELARRCAGLRVGCIAGLLFAVHPVHVEVVAQVVGRAELCCALGVIGALLLLARRPLTGWRVAAIVGCQVLALLSKEQGVLLPALLLLFVLLLWRQAGEPQASDVEKQNLRWLAIAVCWGLAGYLIAREHFLRFEWDRSFLDWGMQPMVASVGASRVLMPVVLLGHYAALLVFPAHLSLDYGADVIGSVVRGGDPYLWIGVATVAAWAAAAWVAASGWAAWRGRGLALFCLLSMALLYGMVGNILTLIGVNLAERLMYLPSAFFLILVALLLARLPRGALVPVVAILVLAGGIRSFTYARQWNDRLGLYTAALAREPGSTQIRLLVAQEYLQRGDPSAAERIAVAATAAFPRYGPAWVERGRVERELGDLHAAQQSLQRAFVLSPSLVVGQMQQDVNDLIQQRAAKQRASRSAVTHPAAGRAAVGRK